MARLTRKQQKIFAENATNNGVFGSLQSNNPVTSNDPDVLQGRPAFEEGWNDATYSAELLPPLEEFQGLQYLFSRQFAYLFQEGIAEWDANTTYYKGSIVKTISGTQIVIYLSLIDNNIGNQATDTTKWQKLFDSDDNYAFDALVVHKAGSETITGDKTFTGNNTFTGDITKTGAFSGNATVGIKVNDTNSKGYIENAAYYANNIIYNRLLAYNLTAEKNAYADVQCKDDGTRVFNAYGGIDEAYVPTPSSATDNSKKAATTEWVRNHRCTTAATTTSTASVDAPAYVVQNYKNGANWYRVWSDGWIEQGGIITSGVSINGNGTQSLWTPFTDTKYTLLLTPGVDATAAGFDTGTQGFVCYTRRTTSDFKWKITHTGTAYYANTITWYACGY